MKNFFSLLCVFFIVSMVYAGKKGIKNHITETRLGGYEEMELASGDLNIKKFASNNLTQEECSVSLLPRKGTVAIKYKRLGLKERLILDADARTSLLESYKSYMADYEDKKLNRNIKKFDAKYSKARVRIDWGAFTYNTFAEPIAEFGYIFVGKSPYFAIHIQSAKSEETKGDITPEYSGSILYFTRSQIKTLCDAISEDSISSAISGFSKDAIIENDYEEPEF